VLRPKFFRLLPAVNGQQCRRFGQAVRRRAARLRKPGRSSEDTILHGSGVAA
jgi:hypothetical protein